MWKVLTQSLYFTVCSSMYSFSYSFSVMWTFLNKIPESASKIMLNFKRLSLLRTTDACSCCTSGLTVHLVWIKTLKAVEESHICDPPFPLKWQTGAFWNKITRENWSFVLVLNSCRGWISQIMWCERVPWYQVFALIYFISHAGRMFSSGFSCPFRILLF